MRNENRNNNNMFWLIAGAAIGAGAAYYLNTPEGKRLTKKVSDKSMEYKDTIVDTSKSTWNEAQTKAQSFADDVKSKAQNALDSASASLENLKQNIQTKSSQFANTVEDEADDFQKGINKAKASINNGATV